MATKYGKTWWGEHWLRSLQNVDYDNRLPRGVSYARNGHVKEVKIKENVINAKVAGSRPSPYKVTIIVPPFFEEQTEQLMQEIISRPALISKLLNRELDPEILTIAENLGLKVFPKQWTDFKMQCSCPDWAVPCKHLASVIYMLSLEIDNNPFKVFEIHKVNLIEELNKRGIFVSDIKKNEIPVLSRLLKAVKPGINGFEEEKAYARVDFSALHNLTQSIVQLLPDDPSFYSRGNFREKFSLQFFHNAKEATRILKKKLDFDVIFPSGTQKLVINHRSTINLIVDNYYTVTVRGENHNIEKTGQLIPAIFSLNADHLPDYQPSVAAFHKVLPSLTVEIFNNHVIRHITTLF